MAKAKVIAVLTAATIALTGCASHVWAPGPGASLPYGVASGQCKLLAESGGSSSFAAAAGRPAFVGAFVGASLIGGATANGIHKQGIYNDCMEASGFVPVDEQQTAAPVSRNQGGHYP